MRTPAADGEKPSTNCRYWVATNRNPKRAKNSAITVALAALKRGLRKSPTSSSGSAGRRCRSTNALRRTTAPPPAASTAGEVHPSDGASMTAHASAIRPAADSAAPRRSRRRPTGSRDSGTRRGPRTTASTHSGTLTMKIEPHQKWSSRTPPATGPSATPRPAVAAQMPTAVARSRSSGEHADEQRQRRGHDERGARAHQRAAGDQGLDAAGERGRRRRQPEHDQPGEQRAPAPVAVPERAGREQQSREHERVGVDHPLQLADVRVELSHQGGERDVDDRVVDDDHEQARAEHAEREPARPGPGGHDVTTAPAAGSARAARRSRTSSTDPKAISQMLQRT